MSTERLLISLASPVQNTSFFTYTFLPYWCSRVDRLKRHPHVETMHGADCSQHGLALGSDEQHL